MTLLTEWQQQPLRVPHCVPGMIMECRIRVIVRLTATRPLLVT